MSKPNNRKEHRKPRPTTHQEAELFKKYAAPWSKNFLYFDQLQEEFYLRKKDHERRRENGTRQE